MSDYKVTNAETIYAKDFITKGPWADVRAFGATGDGVTDDTAAIQAVINATPNNGTILIPDGIFLAQGLYAWQNDLNWICNGWLKPISNIATPVFYIGRNSSGQTTITRRWRGNLKIGSTSDTYTTWDDVIGIQCDYLIESNLHIDVLGLGKGLCLSPAYTAGGGATNAFVAYNHFVLGNLKNNKIGVEIDPKDASSSANENRFYGGNLSINSGTYSSGVIYIKITYGNGHPPDNNIFYSPSLEGTGQVFNCDGNSNMILDARMEVSFTGTPGVDYAHPYISFGANGGYNTFDVNKNTDFIANLTDLGAGTRVTNKRFTVATDLTSWLWPGSPIIVTVGGSDYFTYVGASSYSAPNTTVYAIDSIITDNPTAVKVLPIQKLSLHPTSKIKFGTVSYTAITPGIYDVKDYAQIFLMRSNLLITSRSTSKPALTLMVGGDNADKLLSIQNFSSETGYIDGNGIGYFSNLYPMTDNTHYLGKNDDDSPAAWKGVILKDQGGTGKYYRLEVFGDALRIVDLTD